MRAAPLRVAFAGLAHTHPRADAANVHKLGAVVVAAQDSDPVAAAVFCEEFGGVAVSSVADLGAHDPDVIIATPRYDEVVPLVHALRDADTSVPVFFNKVVAATEAQLHALDDALEGSTQRVGTASVLRFAPALQRFAIELEGEDVLAVRAHAQMDIAPFRVRGRFWQDDPAAGGGTLITVGLHAWEMIGRIAPGAVFEPAWGWTRRCASSWTRSEDVAGIGGELHRLMGGIPLPLQVTVSGVPGPDRYTLDVSTARGLRTLELGTGDADVTLGYVGLIQALLAKAPSGEPPAPWSQARSVVANSVRAAAAARASAQVTRQGPGPRP